MRRQILAVLSLKYPSGLAPIRASNGAPAGRTRVRLSGPETDAHPAGLQVLTWGYVFAEPDLRPELRPKIESRASAAWCCMLGVTCE